MQVYSNEPMRDGLMMGGAGGRELIYDDSQGRLIRLPLESDGGVLRAGKPSQLFEIPAMVGAMDSRDGERFLVDRLNGATAGSSIRLVLGWTGLLRK